MTTSVRSVPSFLYSSANTPMIRGMNDTLLQLGGGDACITQFELHLIVAAAEKNSPIVLYSLEQVDSSYCDYYCLYFSFIFNIIFLFPPLVLASR